MSSALPSGFDLSGRIAIVTGASSGLGAHFAAVLARHGAIVIAAARRGELLEELAAKHETIEPFVCDVGADEDRKRLVETVVERYGRLDVLVNNAGLGGGVAAEEEDTAYLQQMVDVNIVGLFGLAQLAGRQMLQQGSGSIVNVASIFGLTGAAPLTQSAYAASKGGVVNLTRQLGAEWARRGVRVNAIAPGFFPSEMTAGIWDEPRGLEFLRRRAPIGRTGELHELDGVLLLLASNAGSYLIGQTIAVDGGWTAV